MQPPEQKKRLWAKLGCARGSADDLLATTGPEMINVTIKEPASLDFPRPPSRGFITPSPSQTPVQTPRQSPVPPGGSDGKRTAISTAFKTFSFYPERRVGRGPKRVRDDLDRTFAISSDVMVSELKRKKEEKEAKEAKAKERTSRGRGRRKTTAPQREESSESEHDDPSSPLPHMVESDEEDLNMDTDQLCVKVRLISKYLKIL